MSLLKCSKCGGYNDPSEWPEESRDEFNPSLCFNCFRNASVEKDDEKEDEDVQLEDDPDGLRAADEAEQESAEGEADDVE